MRRGKADWAVAYFVREDKEVVVDAKLPYRF